MYFFYVILYHRILLYHVDGFCGLLATTSLEWGPSAVDEGSPKLQLMDADRWMLTVRQIRQKIDFRFFKVGKILFWGVSNSQTLAGSSNHRPLHPKNLLRYFGQKNPIPRYHVRGKVWTLWGFHQFGVSSWVFLHGEAASLHSVVGIPPQDLAKPSCLITTVPSCWTCEARDLFPFRKVRFATCKFHSKSTASVNCQFWKMGVPTWKT